MGIADATRTYRAIADHPDMAAADRATFLTVLETADPPEALAALAASVAAYVPPTAPTESVVSG